MRVSIFGLGYVGAVCTASLAQRGHHVVGVDVSPIKIDLINSGRSPIVEPGLEELLRSGRTDSSMVLPTGTSRFRRVSCR
mgnify:CR=1 FL=1